MSERYWSKETKVYSDGCFEVLWGVYLGGSHKSLGVHWLKTDESCSCPVLYDGILGWMVIPSFLVLPILYSLLSEVSADPTKGSFDAIVCAIQEYSAERKG